MTGKSQEQAVNILRSIKGQVRLLIERRVTVTSPIGSKKLVRNCPLIQLRSRNLFFYETRVHKTVSVLMCGARVLDNYN